MACLGYWCRLADLEKDTAANTGCTTKTGGHLSMAARGFTALAQLPDHDLLVALTHHRIARLARE
ncbi:hypothetical protein L2216_19350, partial [Xanthomonas perforans]|nr:hypothetical protein [Xanthomonas perforans]